MFDTLNDPVDVLTVFVDGKVRPLRFRWRGRVVRVRNLTGMWQRREGSSMLQYFSVEGSATDSYELCYDPRSSRWILSRAWSADSSRRPE